MEYKKSYLGFLLWMAVFVAATGACCFLPVCGPKDFILAIGLITMMVLFLLTLQIFWNERVYWYSGISYEQAKQAGSQRRRKYARAHLMRFGIGTGLFVIWCILSWMAGFPYWIDLLAEIAAVVGTALSTIPIKL